MDVVKSEIISLQAFVGRQEIARLFKQKIRRNSEKYGGGLFSKICQGDGGSLPRACEGF